MGKENTNFVCLKLYEILLNSFIFFKHIQSKALNNQFKIHFDFLKIYSHNQLNISQAFEHTNYHFCLNFKRLIQIDHSFSNK